MKIEVQALDGNTVVTIAGAINAKTAPEAKEFILPLIKSGKTLVLDMTAVDYMSSAGLRVLLLLYRQSASSGGRIALLGLSDEVKDVMKVTGFLGFFTLCDSVEDAVKTVG